jgi:hypothetical protein
MGGGPWIGGVRAAARVRAVTATAAVLVAVALGVAGCGASEASSQATGVDRSAQPADSRAAGSHVVVIVLENQEAPDVLGHPASSFLRTLTRRGGLATRSYGVAHPSLPNYIALTSGSTHGIDDNCTSCRVDAPNLVDQLERAGLSWGAYMGGMPEPCFGGVEVGEYVKRHNPFAYYDSVAANPDRCRKVVPLRRLASDLRAGSLPTVAVVIPGQCENTHDCDVGAGDRFLARAVPPLLRALGPHGYLVVTWDEGATDAGCCGGSDGGRIATTVVGPDVQPGGRDGTPVDHYGVLGTIEDSLGLPRLGEARSGRHGDLEGLFVRPPVLR